MDKFGWVISTLFVFIVMSCCGAMFYETYYPDPVVGSNQYIEVYANDNHLGTVGYVKNISCKQIRVKCISIGKGEFTEWIKVLEPNKTITTTVKSSYGYYIYNLEGIELSYLHATKGERNE